jgi:hypothetical protein
MEGLVPVSNDSIERLGTKTEGVVGLSPSILDMRSPSVVSCDVEDTPKRVGVDVGSLLKRLFFQSGMFRTSEKF